MGTRLKIMIGLILVFCLLIVVGGTGFYGQTFFQKKSAERDKILSLQTFFQAKIIDHLKWDRLLVADVFQGGTEQVQIDPTKCNLGKWYYGYIQSEDFKTLPPSIQELTLELKKPHENLHSSAGSIFEKLNAGNRKTAADVYTGETKKHLAETQKIIFAINSEIEKLAVKNHDDLEADSGRIRAAIIATIAVGAVVFMAVLLYSFRVLGMLKKIGPFTDTLAKASMGDLMQRYPLTEVNCSEIMQCGQEQCPDYGRDGVLCWFDVGSYAPRFGKQVHCPKILNKVYRSCNECRVYKSVNIDEVHTLAAWYNKLIDNIRDMVTNINRSAGMLNEAAMEIASGNENLSQRTSEQASALEEIAATIEEAAAAINQNSDTASNADRLSGDSVNLAKSGGELVIEAVNAINAINQTSARISEITGVINDITFQTNLLALNAAVEAARAGEQGRGFAVVAGEVRNLAGRAASSSKEITVLILDAIKKINLGTQKVNQSGEALLNIIESVNNVRRLVSEINASSGEQKQGITQINNAIAEMDSMTQQNASLVEETSSASQQMSAQAQELLDMVNFFKMDENRDRL